MPTLAETDSVDDVVERIIRKYREESSMSNEQADPETKGVTVKLLATVDLGPEIDGMAGRHLRMRMVTIEPGGVFGLENRGTTTAVEISSRKSKLSPIGDETRRSIVHAKAGPFAEGEHYLKSCFASARRVKWIVLLTASSSGLSLARRVGR